MILRELFYYNKDTFDFEEDPTYDADQDISHLTKKDSRKSRLTLKQINHIRKSREHHKEQEKENLEFIRKMYKSETPQQPF